MTVNRSYPPSEIPPAPIPPMLEWGMLVAFLILSLKWLASYLLNNQTKDDEERKILLTTLLEENKELTRHLIETNKVLISLREKQNS